MGQEHPCDLFCMTRCCARVSDSKRERERQNEFRELITLASLTAFDAPWRDGENRVK